MAYGFQIRKRRECDACGRKFASDEDLMNHKQVFHGKNLEYDCQACGMHFSSMESMRAHLQREHKYTGSKSSNHDNSMQDSTS